MEEEKNSIKYHITSQFYQFTPTLKNPSHRKFYYSKNATLSPSFEPSVYIAEYSDVTDLISAKCC